MRISFSCDYHRSVVIWSISSAYFFHSLVTKIDQLLYDRWSVVRIFIELWLKLARKKKRKLFKQQEPIYFKLTEIQEADRCWELFFSQQQLLDFSG